jgi:hypothetical protein
VGRLRSVKLVLRAPCTSSSDIGRCARASVSQTECGTDNICGSAIPTWMEDRSETVETLEL